MKRLFLLSSLLVLLLITSGFSQDSLNICQVSSSFDYWHSVNDAVYEGDYLYLAAGNSGLRVMDVSDPDSMIEVSSLKFRGNVTDLFKEGNLLFVMDYPCGIRIIDISDINNPLELCLYEYVVHSPILKIVNNYMFVGSRFSDEIYIIDISDPADPFLASILELEVISDFFIEDYMLYAGSFYNGCYMVDVQDPCNPVVLRDHTIYEGVCSLLMINDQLFIHSKFAIISYEINENLDLIETGRFEDWNEIVYMLEKDNLIYNLNYNHIDIIDVSVPGVFNHVLNRTYTFGMESITLGEDIIYGIRGEEGLTTIDIHDLENVLIRDSIENKGKVLSSIRIDNLDFVALEKGGIKVMDISDPAAPLEISTFTEIETVMDLEYTGEYLLAAAPGSGLYVIDIIDPGDLFICGFLEEMYGYNKIEYLDGYIYAINGINGVIDMHVIELLDDNIPVLAGVLDENRESIRALSADDNYVYCTGGGSTMKMVYVDNPQNPFIAGRLNADFHPYDIKFNNGYAYIGSNTDKIYIYRIDSPENINYVSRIDTRGSELMVVWDNDFLYSLSNDGWFEIFDVSDPYNPQEVGYYFENNNYGGIDIQGRYAYLTDSHKFRILDCTEAINWQNFQPVEPTNHSWQININHINIDGEEFAYRDEVAVYDGNTCVGSLVYDEEQDLQINCWRGNETPHTPGYEAGNPIIFKLWVDSEEREYFAEATYISGDGTFEGGPVTVVNLELTYEETEYESSVLPITFLVENPYPNPFNSSVAVPFSIPRAGNINMKIYNSLGQLVGNRNKWFTAGNHRLSFNSSDFTGINQDKGLGSGIYFFNLQYENQANTVKAFLLK